MNEDRLRLSDTERDAAAADLGEHYAQGRLSAEEHDERLTAVWAAKTRGELPGLFADLPSPFARTVAQPVAQPVPAPPTAAWPAARRSRGLPPAVKVTAAVLLAILVLTHLPLVLLAGVIWIVIARSHGRPAFRRAPQPHGWAQHHDRRWR